MPDVKTLIDATQRHLRDDGAIWPRSELLDWVRDAYRKLCSDGPSIQRFSALPVPPRHTMTYTHAWERNHLMGGTGRQIGYTSYATRRQTTARWEIEQREGLEPQTGFRTVTQLWEMTAIGGDQDAQYRFALPMRHEQVMQLWHDHKPLYATTTRELDGYDTAWHRLGGDPQWWASDIGNLNTFEIFEVDTNYVQPYHQNDLYGLMRHASGTRTYSATIAETTTWQFAYTTPGEMEDGVSGTGLRITRETVQGRFATQIWEQEMAAGVTALTDGSTIGTYAWEVDHGATNVGNLPVGALRRTTSTERAYVPQDYWADAVGTVREWQSSEETVLVLEAVLPEITDLEDDRQCVPEMLPGPLHKYLTYYVLMTAFNRQGEGYRPDIAAHWQARWRQGLRLMERLKDVAHKDKRMVRGQPPRRRREIDPPQLPSDYPRLARI